MSAPVPVLLRPERPERSAGPGADLKLVAQALDAIPNEDAASLTYDDWRDVVFGIHHASGGSDEGLALAHEFSSRSPKYDAEFLDNRVWPYIRDREGGVTERTIYARAGSHGWSEPIEFEALPDEEGAKPNRERFRLWDEDELCSMPPPKWIIKGVLPQAQLAVVYGASGSGKSFAIVDMVAAVARGEAWRGLKVTQGRVVYVAAEGQAGFRNRLMAYRQRNGAKTGIQVITEAPDIRTADAALLTRQIVAGGGADVIVLDTLAQVSAGGDENSSEDMGKVIKACRLMHEATGALILLVHHSGKDASKGARGWSGLRAAADVEIEVTRVTDRERVLSVTKQKDGEDGKQFGFRLEVENIGVDDDGDVISSCVVVLSDVVGPTVNAKPMGEVQRNVLGAIEELMGLGTDHPVPVNDVIEAAVERKAPPPQGKRDARRQHVSRAFDGLVADGVLMVQGGLVRLATGSI